MTKNEAYAILSINPEDDLEEIYESQLFSFKSFFTSKPIVWGVFIPKIEKLNKLEEAFFLLGIKSTDFDSTQTFKLDKSNIIIELFNDFQVIKNQLYLLIHRSGSIKELTFYVRQLLDVSSDYNSHWPEIILDDTTVLLSNAADLMELHTEMNKMHEMGIRTFQNLIDDKNTTINCVKKESLRLYLLHQKEMEWKRSLPS